MPACSTCTLYVHLRMLLSEISVLRPRASILRILPMPAPRTRSYYYYYYWAYYCCLDCPPWIHAGVGGFSSVLTCRGCLYVLVIPLAWSSLAWCAGGWACNTFEMGQACEALRRVLLLMLRSGGCVCVANAAMYWRTVDECKNTHVLKVTAAGSTFMKAAVS